MVLLKIIKIYVQNFSGKQIFGEKSKKKILPYQDRIDIKKIQVWAFFNFPLRNRDFEKLVTILGSSGSRTFSFGDTISGPTGQLWARASRIQWIRRKAVITTWKPCDLGVYQKFLKNPFYTIYNMIQYFLVLYYLLNLNVEWYCPHSAFNS